MSEEYTPTTEQVENAYVRFMRNAFIASEGEHKEEFKRWLDEAMAFAWEKGRTAGSSVAMRRMSDEPLAPSPINPFGRKVMVTE